MASEIATAYLSLVPSAKGIGKSIAKDIEGAGADADKAGQKAGSRFGSGLLSSLKSVTRTAAGIVTGALAYQAVTKGFSAAKGAVFDFNSQLQNANIGFTTMLGSAQKSQQFLGQLQDFAKKTPFDFGGLVNSSQTLLGMGVSAKDIIPTLTALGDSVASVGGSSDQLNNVILAFGQTMAKGTLDMGNMNQMLQGGVPNALKILAAQYHVTTGAMVDMISKGKVQSADALPKLVAGLEKGTSATAALGGMMDQQSVTFSGALGNIGDTLNQTIAGAFKPFFDVTTKGLLKFGDLLGSDKVSTWAANTAKGLSGFISELSKIGPAIQSGRRFRDLTADATPLVKVFHGLGEGLSIFKGAWADFTQNLKNGFDGKAMSAQLGTVDRALHGIGNAAYIAQSGVQTALGAIKAGFTGNANYLKGSNPVIQALYSIGNTASKVDFKGLFSSLGKAFETFAPQVLAIVRNTSPLSLIFKALQPLLPPLVKAFVGLVQAVGGLIAKVLPDAVQLTQQFANIAIKTLAKVLPVVVKGVTDFTKALTAAVKWLSQHKTLVEAVALAIGTYLVVMKTVKLGVAVWETLTKVTKIYAAAQKALNIIMATNPIVLIIAAVAALAVGLVYAYKKSETFRNFVNKAFADVKAIALDIAHWFTGVFVPVFTKTLPQAFETFAGYFVTGWDALKQGVSTFVGFFTKTIPDAFKSVIGWVQKNWPLLAQIVIGIFLFPAGTIAAAIWHFKDAILGFFAGLWKDLSSNVSKGVGAIVGFFTGLPGKVVGGLSSLKSGVVGKFDEVVSWLKGVPGKLASVGSGMWGWILDEFKGAWLDVSSWFGTMLDWVGGFGDDIKGVVTGMWDALTGAAKTAFNWVARAWNDTVGKLSFTVPSWVPEIGGKGWSVPDIPYLAKGTDFFQGGLAVVGERGPEIVDLPRGSRVIPAGPTQDILNGRGQGATFNVNNYGEPWNAAKVWSDFNLAYKAGLVPE